MDWLIIIIAIVYSIWSEVNKKKEEENIDFDFSDLSSIEDFIKKDNPKARPVAPATADNSPLSQSSHQERINKRQMQKKSGRSTFGDPDNASELQSSIDLPDHLKLPELVNYDRKEVKKPVNYDQSDSMTGVCTSQTLSAKLEQQRAQVAFLEGQTQAPAPLNVTMNRNNLIQAFIISEVMTRYDINRIYERVPGVRKDDE